MTNADRRLLWHGMLVVVLGLVVGFGIPAFANPRMGVAAHVGALMNGMLVVLFGLLWPHLRLAERWRRAAFSTAIFSAYANTAALTLAAAFGTSRMTPLAGAGHAGSGLQEAVVDVLLVAAAVATLAAAGLVLAGLGRRA